MSKTIEEATKKAIIDNDFFMVDPNHSDFVDRGLEQMRACKWVIGHIFSLPLTSRMTKEEKERVRKIRDMYYSKWREHSNEATEAVYCAIKGTLESIFGKELFKEE